MENEDRFYWNGRWVPSGTTVLGLIEKAALVPWAAGCAVDYLVNNRKIHNISSETEELHQLARTAYEQVSTEAADYGTYIHKLCEVSLTNDIQIESPDEMTNDFMKGLWEWKNKHNVKVIAMEHEVLSKWYGGRLDLVCELDGVVTLIDFKTGKGAYYDTWKYQLAGYRNAWHNREAWNNGEIYPNIQHHGILKFNKKKTKTKGYSVNYKDFTEYEATRKCVDKPRVDGKLQTEKYIRTYETDLTVFMSCVMLWWSMKHGIDIDELKL